MKFLIKILARRVFSMLYQKETSLTEIEKNGERINISQRPWSQRKSLLTN